MFFVELNLLIFNGAKEQRIKEFKMKTIIHCGLDSQSLVKEVNS